MAQGGGGSWKVAYADFVTAMMAFFLVMWLGSQDEKVKQAVANYFVDPSGVSKKPSKTGATFNAAEFGNVPKEEGVSMARGRNSYTLPSENSPSTKLVGDWLHSDKAAMAYWKEQARKHRDSAAKSPDVQNKSVTVNEAATQALSKQLKEEITRGIPAKSDGVYQDLLFGVAAEVNWTELAEDLLTQ